MQLDRIVKSKRLIKESTQISHYDFTQQVGFLLRLAYQRHSSIFASRMPADITQTQFAALVALYKHGHCAHNALGQLICLDAATIKGVVDRLHARGLVETWTNENDRRSRTVTLSADGRRLVETVVDAASEITRETLSPLSPEEQTTFLGLLRRLS